MRAISGCSAKSGTAGFLDAADNLLTKSCAHRQSHPHRYRGCAKPPKNTAATAISTATSPAANLAKTLCGSIGNICLKVDLMRGQKITFCLKFLPFFQLFPLNG